MDFFKKLFKRKDDGGHRRFILPAIALLIILGNIVSGKGLAVEVEPGEVAVIYNQTGSTVFGDDVRVQTEQGVIWFMPFFQRVEKLEVTLKKEAEAMIAKIKAVGEQGPDVLNREIATHIFPQLVKISASPFTKPTTPFDIRTGSR